MKKIILLLIIFLTSCSRNVYENINLFYMDTYINIKVYSKDFKLKNKIKETYEYYHKLTDRYNSYENVKNVYYLNEILKENEYIEIDENLYDILKLSLQYNKETNNKFNIALANPLDVWRNSKVLPTFEKLSSKSYNINDIKLNNKKFMKTSDVKIDLGAIAKGYATEKVKKILETNNYKNYLINAGGHVIAGDHYKNSTYRIGLEDPTENNIYKVLNIKNQSVVSSGGYNRYYEFDNKKYSHIIDPETLFPKEKLLSVTVITKDSTYADVLSTYLSLLSVDEGLDIINKLDNVEAIFYIKTNDIKYSKGISKYE